MARDEIEVLRGVYAEWGHGNFRAGMELFDADIELVMHATPDPGTYRGLDAVQGFMRDFLKQWSRYTIEAQELLGSGEKVLVVGMQHAVAAQTGIELELPTNAVWTFRNGRVARMLWTLDRNEALQEAGLPPA